MPFDTFHFSNDLISANDEQLVNKPWKFLTFDTFQHSKGLRLVNDEHSTNIPSKFKKYFEFKYFNSSIFFNLSHLQNIFDKFVILFFIIILTLFSPFFSVHLLIKLVLSPFITKSILSLLF